jgi:hypothetical protein
METLSDKFDERIAAEKAQLLLVEVMHHLLRRPDERRDIP